MMYCFFFICYFLSMPCNNFEKMNGQLFRNHVVPFFTCNDCNCRSWLWRISRCNFCVKLSNTKLFLQLSFPKIFLNSIWSFWSSQKSFVFMQRRSLDISRKFCIRLSILKQMLFLYFSWIYPEKSVIELLELDQNQFKMVTYFTNLNIKYWYM